MMVSQERREALNNMTPRERIESSPQFRSGDLFFVSSAAHAVGVPMVEAVKVIAEMEAEGVVRAYDNGRNCGAGRRTQRRYYRVSRGAQLLKKLWNESLKWEEAVA